MTRAHLNDPTSVLLYQQHGAPICKQVLVLLGSVVVTP